MTSTSKLLPCPFCGGEVQWKDGRIRCENCDFGFRRYFDHEKNNQAWNTRAELGNQREKELEQLVRDIYDVAASGEFDVGEESKFSERMAKLGVVSE